MINLYLFCEVLNLHTIYDVLNFLTTNSTREYKNLELKIDHGIVSQNPYLFYDRYYNEFQHIYDVLSCQVTFPTKFIFYYVYWSEYKIEKHYGVIESTETNSWDRKYLNLFDYGSCHRIFFEPGYFSNLFKNFKNHLFCSEVA